MHENLNWRAFSTSECFCKRCERNIIKSVALSGSRSQRPRVRRKDETPKTLLKRQLMYLELSQLAVETAVMSDSEFAGACLGSRFS